jgi:hypothetical protein
MSTLDEYKDKYATQLIQALDQFQKIHAPKGFIDTKENGEALLLHLAQNNMPPTLASLEQSAQMHVAQGWKFYLSADEQAFNAVRAQYNADTLAIFDRWYGYQHIEKNPRTAAAILSECQGHVVDKAFLDLALGRAASKGKVSFLRAPGQSGYIAGQYSDKNLRDEVKPEEVTDALGVPLHRAQNTVRGEAARQYMEKLNRDAEAGRAPADQTEQYWIERADKAAGANLASTRGELVRMIVTKPGGGIDWKATAEAREARQKGIGSR